LLLFLLYLPDKCLITGGFVLGCPENHFREDWRKIDALCRQRLNPFSPLRGISLGSYDSTSLERLQAVCQDV